MIPLRWWRRYWFAALALLSKHPESEVGGLELIDLRADRQSDHHQIHQTLAEALERVAQAGGEFPELLKSNLRCVIALDSEIAHASPFAEALYTGFRAWERADTVLFASRLVWAAMFIRVARSYSWWQRRRRWSEARAAADDAQLRFVDQFPRDTYVDFVEPAGP